jgi:iron complex outermembrane receptor protein
VGSATIYYEKSGFQFRVGERYRSGFTATRHNAFRFVMDTIRPEFITDVQAGYTIQHGALKGLGALVEVNNLFDEPYVVTQTAEGQTVLKEYHQFGRQYLFGLSYKF